VRWGIFSVLVALALVLPASALAAPPANDDFANRQVLSGTLPIEVTGSNAEATKEEGEFIPSGPAPAGHSVWFEWEAEADGWVSIGACDNEFPTILAVFTGTALNALTPAANGNGSEGPDCPYSGRQLTFKAVSGTKYVIAVDGNVFHLPEGPAPVTEGSIKLKIAPTPVPANDAFADATPVQGEIIEELGGRRFYFAAVKGFNWTATTERGSRTPRPRGPPSGTRSPRPRGRTTASRARAAGRRSPSTETSTSAMPSVSSARSRSGPHTPCSTSPRGRRCGSGSRARTTPEPANRQSPASTSA
jgi:hypothetical protein